MQYYFNIKLKGLYKRPFVYLFLSLIFISCQESQLNLFQFEGKVFGANYSVKYFDSKNRKEIIIKNIEHIFNNLDKTFSTYRDDSEISKINSSQQKDLEISYEFYNILLISSEIHKQTKGYFNPLIGNLVKRWGFGPDKKFIGPPLESEVAELLNTSNFNNLFLYEKESKYFLNNKGENSFIDFNSIVPGYAADKISDFLKSIGIHNFLIDVGGELKSNGKKITGDPWVVGIEYPKEVSLNRFISKIKLSDGNAVATSGSYRNYLKYKGTKFHHTIDPFTGSPSKHSTVSLTVIHPNCAKADAYATAFLSMGIEKALEIAKIYKIPIYALVEQNNAIIPIKNTYFDSFFIE